MEIQLIRDFPYEDLGFSKNHPVKTRRRCTLFQGVLLPLGHVAIAPLLCETSMTRAASYLDALLIIAAWYNPL